MKQHARLPTAVRSVPPSHDADAEEWVLAEMLYGTEAPEWFDSAWVFNTFARHAIEILIDLRRDGKMPGPDAPPPIAEVAAALQARGFRRTGTVVRELVSCCHRCAPCSVVELAIRIRTMHRRRAALDRLHVLEALLREPCSDDQDLLAAAEDICAALRGPV